MPRSSQRVQFAGHRQHQLSGILELPDHQPRGYMLFSHCFTCSKDIKAIVRISRGLCELGWGVLRYDFAGLGNSQGDFSLTNFSTNREDLRGAADFLAQQFEPPQFLIGHSFGGAASMSMADELSSVKGVVAIASPSDTRHLADLLLSMSPSIETEGVGSVIIGGQTLEIRKQMIDDFRSYDLPATVKRLKKHLLAIHSPADETVHYRNARINCGLDPLQMDEAPASMEFVGNRTLVTLPRCNHLFNDNADVLPMIVESIDRWCQSLVYG
jgi:uncharacterized protein